MVLAVLDWTRRQTLSGSVWRRKQSHNKDGAEQRNPHIDVGLTPASFIIFQYKRLAGSDPADPGARRQFSILTRAPARNETPASSRTPPHAARTRARGARSSLIVSQRMRAMVASKLIVF